MSADEIVMASLRRQTARRHPEWFDLKCHPQAFLRDLKKARLEKQETKKRMVELAEKRRTR